MRVVFPAYAGMSLITSLGGKKGDGFPRLRGDEPRSAWVQVAVVMFSPPTRG